MQKLGVKLKLKLLLMIGRPWMIFRPLIILVMALVVVISVVTPTYAMPLIPLLIWVGAIATAGVGAWYSRGWLLKKLAEGTAGIFLELVQVLIVILQPILVPFITGIIAFGLGNPNLLLDATVINTIWRTALEIANAAFLLAILIASLAIILRINTGVYTLKKFLSGFIQAVILANLSLIIVRALVALGDQLTHAIILMGGSLGISLPATGTLGNNLAIEANTPGAVAMYFVNMIGMHVDVKSWSVESLAIAVVEIAIFLISAWIIIKFGLVLIERMIRLFTAAVTAPVIFAGSLLPSFQKKTAEWWEDTIKWILVLPITMAFLLVSLMFFKHAGINKPADMVLIHKIIMPPFLKKSIEAYTTGITPTDPSMDELTRFAYALMGLFVLWSAGMVSNKFNLKSALGGIVDTPQKALALGQKGYKTMADTFTGKNLQGKLLKGAGGAIYTAALTKPTGQAIEAWRQSRKGIPGWLVNRKNEAARVKSDNEKGVQEQMQNQASKRYAKTSKRLDTIAAGIDPGKTWDQLEEDQRKTARIANKSIAGIEEGRKDDSKWITSSANKQAKETDVNQMEGTDEMIKKIRDHVDKSEIGKANFLMAQLKKKFTASGVSAEEKDKIRDYIINEGYDMGKRNGYSFPKLYPKAVPQQTPDTSTSYVDLDRATKQKNQNLADLASAGLVDPTDQATLGAGNHGTGVIDLTALSALAAAINNSAGIASLTTTGGAMAALKSAVASGDTAAAKNILANNGLSDSNEQNAIINSARTMSAEDLTLQLKLMESAKAATPAGGNVNQTIAGLVNTIKQLQGNTQTISQITNNQANIQASSGVNYQSTINNRVNAGNASGNPVTMIDTNRKNNVIKDVSEVKQYAQDWIEKITEAVNSNPKRLSGDSSVNHAPGVDQGNLIKTLQNLGVGTDLSSTITIDDALERLHLIMNNAKKP